MLPGRRQPSGGPQQPSPAGHTATDSATSPQRAHLAAWLQLGVRGSRQGVGFTRVGRLQYGYEGGTWNEWHALLEQSGPEQYKQDEQGEQAPRSAWLSEDNGAYVLAFDAPLPGDAPRC